MFPVSAQSPVARRLLTRQDAFQFLLLPRLDPDLPNIGQLLETGARQVDLYAYLKQGHPSSRHYLVAMDSLIYSCHRRTHKDCNVIDPSRQLTGIQAASPPANLTRNSDRCRLSPDVR